ncbi:NADH-quinone oxidoreductase subunit NuoK [Halarchaeum nitratireducens]|uniref:NADH-quinone oxidoreductase subunit K n=1 Tax=Halarchaeum nitratireducens TaxID=489913 RepID=A0A830GC39_9EURY|nr:MULTISPECIES: NADH-quinone oxidoreductase subunit NuoK [Halarchaeum]MBP2250835.1 NADH-quinone oxidoreductase subunit K [Halarchaeum solikamskense]GGN19307.1 NADH-quinone oxidoreductase subunit K [Halarchaeum nitratireducens]
MVPLEYYLLFSAAMFCIGVFGVLARRNALVYLMSVELMLNAANVVFVASSAHYGTISGQVFSLFTMALAAAEVAVGVGIVLVAYRKFKDIDITNPTSMRW